MPTGWVGGGSAHGVAGLSLVALTGGQQCLRPQPHSTGEMVLTSAGAPPLARWGLTGARVPGPSRTALGVSRCHGNL